MDIKYNINKKQTREFMLAHQNLLGLKELVGKKGVLDYLNKVGCIQYDPLDQVGQNHHLVLQSRIKNYKKEMAQNLLYKERKIIDGWDKNKSIYPISDRPYFERYRKEAYQKYFKEAQDKVKESIPKVRKILKESGPLSATDLNFDEKIDWSWSPARISKVILSSMYKWGELIIHHRVGTKKVYGLAKRYVPEKVYKAKRNFRTQQAYYNWHFLRRTGSIGLVRNLSETTWLGIKNMKKQHRDQAIDSLVKDNKLIPINIEGLKRNYYLRQNEEELLNKVISGLNYKKEVSFLAPLDNLIWNREMISDIFNFDYTWEVYKPVEKRKYGYYVLPVLYGDKFMGRFEPKFDKENKNLIIKNWWWEQEFSVDKKCKDQIKEAIEQFMQYLGAENLIIQTDNIDLKK